MSTIGESVQIFETNLKSLKFINQVEEVPLIELSDNEQMTNCDFPNLDMANVSITSDLSFSCNGQ